MKDANEYSLFHRIRFSRAVSRSALIIRQPYGLSPTNWPSAYFAATGDMIKGFPAYSNSVRTSQQTQTLSIYKYQDIIVAREISALTASVVRNTNSI